MSSSISEHLGRETRYRLFCLVYNAVKDLTDKERALKKKKGEKAGKGRPAYVSLTAELLGVSRETASAWKRRSYQAKNVNAEKLVDVAWSFDNEETEKILREALESHREKLENFLLCRLVSTKIESEKPCH